MKHKSQRNSRLTRLALGLACMLGAALPAQSNFLAIFNEPLGAPASSILPNIMFILDDSGSMGSEFMPEYVNDVNGLTSGDAADIPATAGCFDSGDDTAGGEVLGTINGPTDGCVFGDPPYNSAAFNEIYYNPAITYQTGVNPPDAVTGVITDMPSQTSAATAGWTAVAVNPYTNPGSTTNLLVNFGGAGFGDRVWCKDKADSATGGNCRQNTAYQYPDDVFKFGKTTGGAVKYLPIGPYYYVMQTAQFCKDKDVNDIRFNCLPGVIDPVTGLNYDPAVYKYQAEEFCTDRDLTNCAAGTAVTPAHIFSGVRWCADPTTLVDCRKKKGGEPIVPVADPPAYKYFIHPKHLGVTASQTGTFPELANEGNILVNSVTAGSGTIANITIGGVSVISGPINFLAGSSPNSLANLIATRIGVAALVPPQTGGHISTPDYTATASGSNVVITRVITPPDTGATGAGAIVTVASNAVGTVASQGKITISTANDGSEQIITEVTVNGVNLLCLGTSGSYGGSITVLANGNIRAAGGTNGTTKRTEIRKAIRDRINICAVNGFSATIVGSDVRIFAPVTRIIAGVELGGATPNGQAVSRAGTGTMANFVVGNMGSVAPPGESTGDASTSVIAMSGGQDAFTGTRTVRLGVGAFSRFDVVSSNNSYPRGPKRSDCAGATCTFDEEMTNIANWHAYHRTRMQMMKTAVGRAFVPIDSSYRMGFITICPVTPDCTGADTTGRSVVSAKYLKIADFNIAHKKSWYEKLYAQTPGGNTPLREALSRVGQIYAGDFGSGLTTGLTAADDDPMTRSCQPSFALLSTDGYWNGGGGRKKDGLTPMGNVDNVNTGPYSKQSQGVFDGDTPVAADTLADVALYYYITDLRTTGPNSQNNVPIAGKDTNQAQHMVTFTIGLGLEGDLTFRPDYESATAGDFFDITQGTKKWPKPVQNKPSTLDDLWHAAVNGRGVFYSIKNPEELATGLADMRAQLAARLGAGASAATSNLTPVAGDNFAFTGSFTTSSWIGDLKSRTIDLTTGVVSEVALWAAASFLDTMAYTNRVIYTFDPANTVGAGGQNNNKLKHFCAPGSTGTTCADGAGLTPSPGEMDFFSPTLLPQSFDAGQQLNLSAETIVNYLRGDRSFENSSPFRLLSTDLYRARESVMGDIINAQPAYVKRSPFAYNAPSDAGYLDFRACTEGVGVGCALTQFPDPTKPRRGTVYAAANDGMLHAFETDRYENPYFQTAGISTLSTGDDQFTGGSQGKVGQNPPPDPANGNGVERWAYIPGLVLPNLAALASEPYSHRYITDGTPSVGDICISTPCAGQNDWRTILVAGLNSGGKGYYALDVTNPDVTTPQAGLKALWEVGQSATCLAVDASGVPTAPGPHTSDCHFGLSYGNPVITKRFHDKKWVVIVTSGYHRNAADLGASDGRGYLYVLDAVNGNILHRLNTPLGGNPPAGLSKINAWTDNGAIDNSARAVYGGDLEGNLWRFKLDFNPVDPAPNNRPSVTRVATLMSKAVAAVPADPAAVPPVAGSPAIPSTAQPITVKPELGDYKSERIIVLGTGKFLELADKIAPFQQQTIYALRDDLNVIGAGPVIPDVRDATKVPVRELIPGIEPDERTVRDVAIPPNLAVDSGWLIDLPESGERINVDPILQLGTLVVASNVPIADTCAAGGFSFFNFLDFATGSYVAGSTNNLVSKKVSTSLLVGISVIMLPGGAVKTIGTLADETRRSEATPVPPPGFVGRRVSWRELFID